MSGSSVSVLSVPSPYGPFCSLLSKEVMTPLPRTRFFTPEECSPLFQTNSFRPDLTIFLIMLSLHRQCVQLAAVDGPTNPYTAQQLLSFVLICITVFLVFHFSALMAAWPPLCTRTQFQSRPFGLFLKRCLYAMRVSVFVRRACKQILATTHASSLRTQKKPISQRLWRSKR